MDRRIFIKLVGASTLVDCASLYAMIPEQKWIRCSDRLPEIGQNMVVFCVWEDNNSISNDGLSDDFYVGKMEYYEKVKYYLGDDKEYINMRVALDQNLSYNDKLLLSKNCKDSSSLWFNVKGPSIEIGFWSPIDGNVYWLPIKNKLPNELPKIPKYEKSLTRRQK